MAERIGELTLIGQMLLSEIVIERVEYSLAGRPNERF
jgi:hypothetical protein